MVHSIGGGIVCTVFGTVFGTVGCIGYFGGDDISELYVFFQGAAAQAIRQGVIEEKSD